MALGRLLRDENGSPRDGQWRAGDAPCFVKLIDCEILDTWYTTGLRGTGSNDIAFTTSSSQRSTPSPSRIATW